MVIDKCIEFEQVLTELRRHPHSQNAWEQALAAAKSFERAQRLYAVAPPDRKIEALYTCLDDITGLVQLPKKQEQLTQCLIEWKWLLEQTSELHRGRENGGSALDCLFVHAREKVGKCKKRLRDLQPRGEQALPIDSVTY